jgi:uncharacterized flavoprotein (TIGR03862 family)
MSHGKVCIVGMGPAGLMAGSVLLNRGFEVHFFDHKKAAGRKFLVAGHGGFNLTHSEIKERFSQKYDHPYIQNAFNLFDNTAWINWLNELGIDTFVGSSGKVFPVKGVKPIEVLQLWTSRLKQQGAFFHFSHRFKNYDTEEVFFTHNEKIISSDFHALVFAMGGASWPKTGSTGQWDKILMQQEIECLPFTASNSGFELDHWASLLEFEGHIIKNCQVSLDQDRKLGDIVMTRYGLEGAPIYFLNKAYRSNPCEPIIIDFKPTKTQQEIEKIIASASNATDGLKRLKLTKGTIQLIKTHSTKAEYCVANRLAEWVKAMKIYPRSLRPVAEVISTVGGVSMTAIHENFALKHQKNIYVCGEMLDWDAPTGGYLIQGCVSTGFVAGTSIPPKK